MEREKVNCRRTVEEIQASCEQRVTDERTRREELEKWTEKEFSLLRSLVNKSLAQRTEAMGKLQKIRGIMRAPRLWMQYREKMQKMKGEANLEHVGLRLDPSWTYYCRN